jgi:heat shock protein HtpX
MSAGPRNPPSCVAMPRSANRVFRVSYRVQAAGVVSLVAVPAILATIAWLLVDVSPWLAVAVGAAFGIGLQAAIARRWTGLRPKAVSPHDAPEIHATVERLCTTGDLAKPKIVLHDKRYANSWIKGLTPGRTTLHLTSRLVELLDERQLEAVIAHELSHVGQRDSTLMSAVGAPVAAMLDGAGLYFHTPVAVLHTIRANKTPRGTPSPTIVLIEDSAIAGFFWLLLLPVGLLFLVVGAVTRAITAVFSRARELEADAGAARLTGRPSALASALMVLSSTRLDAIPLVDLRRAASLDVFHIVAIGEEYRLVRTHPSLKRRLRQLSDIETRLQSPEPG